MSMFDTHGDIPLPRFGHTMTLVTKTKVVLFGGATGDTGRYSITGDTYSLDLMSKTWRRLDNIGGIAPTPRAAHASAAVETHQMIIYGGATGGGSLASDDLYLLDLRSGEESATWMIVPVVGITPGRRYGHSAVFSKPHLLVFGGNTGSEAVNDVWCLNVERAPFSWARLDVNGDQPAVRVYHSAALCEQGSATGMMVIFGGRTSDQSALNDIWGLRRHRNGEWDWVKAPYKANSAIPSPRYQHSMLFIGSTLIVVGGRTNQVGEAVPLDVYDTETSEWFKFPSVFRFRHSSWNLDGNIFVHGGFEHEAPNVPTETTCLVNVVKLLSKHEQLLPKHLEESNAMAAHPEHDRIKPIPRASNKTPEIRLANQVLMFVGADDGLGDMVRRVPLDRLQNEGSRIGFKALPPGLIKNQAQSDQLHNLFINELLHPKEWQSFNNQDNFNFQPDYIIALIEECENIVKSQPTVIRLRTPVKIFGDIHGQFVDMLRIFDTWGSPSEVVGEGDIESFDYLFLGDYVDRGNKSLEVICLLMALKCKHPDQIYLLRGNHEDINVNLHGGFADECRARLGENTADPSSVFATINRFFNYLPLACILEDKILCVHAGIGGNMQSIDEIEYLQRPIQIEQDPSSPEQQLLLDVLWSDPTSSESETGVHLNSARRENVYKFGVDRLRTFLNENRLNMIIRSHECVMDGYDRFGSGGELITVFSCSNYCGKHQNAASILLVKKTLEIVPKMIYPLNTDVVSWIETPEMLKMRPPTPPRWKPPAK